MGMFDRVHITCICGKVHEEQSKAGDCTLDDYHPGNVPEKIMLDLDKKTIQCDCGLTIHLNREFVPKLAVSFTR